MQCQFHGSNTRWDAERDEHRLRLTRAGFLTVPSLFGGHLETAPFSLPFVAIYSPSPRKRGQNFSTFIPNDPPSTPHHTHQIFHKDSEPATSSTWCNILAWLLLHLPITASWTETKLEGRNAGGVTLSAACRRQNCLKALARPWTHCSKKEEKLCRIIQVFEGDYFISLLWSLVALGSKIDGMHLEQDTWTQPSSCQSLVCEQLLYYSAVFWVCAKIIRFHIWRCGFFFFQRRVVMALSSCYLFWQPVLLYATILLQWLLIVCSPLGATYIRETCRLLSH